MQFNRNHYIITKYKKLKMFKWEKVKNWTNYFTFLKNKFPANKSTSKFITPVFWLTKKFR